jgi:hypothetical protein
MIHMQMRDLTLTQNDSQSTKHMIAGREMNED